jgi:hypothetical protein
MDLREGDADEEAPNPVEECPPGFGDTDIWSFTTHP